MSSIVNNHSETNQTNSNINNTSPIKITIEDNDNNINEYEIGFIIGITALVGGLIIGGGAGFITGYTTGVSQGLYHSKIIKKLFG